MASASFRLSPFAFRLPVATPMADPGCRSVLGRRHGAGAAALQAAARAPCRPRARRARPALDVRPPRADARGAAGHREPVRPRRPQARRAPPAGSCSRAGRLRPGDRAAQYVQVRAGPVLRRHPDPDRLPRGDAALDTERCAHAGRRSACRRWRSATRRWRLPRGEALRLPLPALALRVDEAARRALLARLGLGRGRPAAALCPGAEYGPAKRWPARYFAELAQGLAAHGCAVWLVGSKNDRAGGRRDRAARGRHLPQPVRARPRSPRRSTCSHPPRSWSATTPA